ncbi:calycin-like domain-containing protein [Dysgonomonas hofstadii]|uniref:calycin-like domain-containing protein n=1 Tax=Dysgonomonas hofstadii TaxID=637886 RepID=UPI001C85FD6F|nr:calycin-like domain-containing protein [Dysgonomonas hofstadii]
MVFSLGLTFTACSDDDDDTTTDYANEIAGTYAGELSIPLGETIGTIKTDKDIALTRTADNVATLKLENLSIPLGDVDFEVGDIVVPNISITKSGSTYTLAETTTTITVPTLEGGTTNANVKVKGTVVSGAMTLTIDVDNVPVFETLTVSFAGDKE